MMNWNRAIEINQNALRSVVAEIFALLELVLDGSIKNLPLALQQAAYRLLIPAESALRRLIIIAARGLKVQVKSQNPWPKGKRITAKAATSLSFQLYDTRKRFNRPSKIILPRLHVFGFTPLVPSFAAKEKTQNSGSRICRRFAAFKLALENIPHQAKRLALWQAKRAALKEAKFRSPLRPGSLPGFRRSLIFEIDQILKECHGLAHDALRGAPS